MEAPKFVHDCDKSIYLGTWVSTDGEIYDLYACTDHRKRAGRTYTGVSLMARYGNDGPEYVSGHIYQGETVFGDLPIQIAAAAYEYKRRSGQL